MTREEFSLLVKGMKAVYADPKFIADKDAFDVWYALLSDLDYEVANQATLRLMKTSNRIPTPADIRSVAYDMATADMPTDAEAWAIVSKALRNATYHAEEEFEKLPDLIKRAVGSAEALRAMGTSEGYNESVESSNFKKTYRVLVDRAKRNETMPNLSRIATKSALQIEGSND